MLPSSSTLHRTLGIEEMFAALNEAGWTNRQIGEYVSKLKSGAYEALDDFAGGELSRSEGTSLHAFLLEATAIRYVLAREQKSGRVQTLRAVKCSHGVVGYCRSCERGEA